MSARGDLTLYSKCSAGSRAVIVQGRGVVGGDTERRR